MLKLVETHCFSNKKQEYVRKYLKICKNEADSGIRKRHFCLFNRVESPHICSAQETNDSANASPRHGNKTRTGKNSENWLD